MKKVLYLLAVFVLTFTLSGCKTENENENYEEFNLFSNGLLAVEKDENWGYIDKDGEVIIDFLYDGAGQFHNGVAVVVANDNYHIIDKSGSNVLEDSYDYLERFEEDVLIYGDNDRFGLLSIEGDIIVDALYNSISSFHDGLAVVESNDEFGMMNIDGEIVVSIQHQFIGSFSNGLALVKDDDKYGYIDEIGVVAIDFLYDNATIFDDYDRAIVCVDEANSCYMIDKEGTTMLNAYDISGNGPLYEVQVTEGVDEYKLYTDSGVEFNNETYTDIGYITEYYGNIEIDFEDKGQVYTIRREQMYKKVNGIMEKSGNEKVNVRYTDPKGNSKSVMNPRAFFHNIIPENLRQFFFFDGEKINRLAQEDGRDEIRDAVLNILGMSVIENLHSDLNKVDIKLDRLYKKHVNKEEGDLLEKRADSKSRIESLEKDRKKINELIKEKKEEEYFSKLPSATIEYCDMVLANSRYPDTFPQEFDIDFNSQNGILVVEYQLPAPEHLPTVKETKYIQSKDEFKEVYISESAQRKLYDKLLYQIALRTIHELYEADVIAALKSIVFNGWVRSVDKRIGKETNSCILSVQANREEFLSINLKLVDPKECFKQLKGVGSSKLHSLSPVAPIINIDKSDKRFVPSHDVAEFLDEGQNLAAMDWEEFEHLVRELFEKEFSQTGGEVKVTQSSRDGGVDAIAFDPDPIRGGKIVIQAKRYTNTVGVSAVRDLYGTVEHEGAIKGILVTTSDYGPDAYKFVKGKPITLLNGGNLLHLLEKHGHKAKIDLKEAKKILSENS